MALSRITANSISDGTVVAADIAANSITTTKIADANITAAKLATSGVSAGTYGGSSNISVVTVNAQGLVTSASNSAINLNSVTGEFTVSGNASINGTGFIKIPSGTTSERPSSTANGQMRVNSTTRELEAYYDGGWYTIGRFSYEIDILVVAGGAGSGIDRSAGSGAGGYRALSNVAITAGQSYTVTVGAGGAGSTPGSYPGNNGNPSSIVGPGPISYSATGGSYGAHGNQGPNAPGGSPGGSGGGGIGSSYPAPTGNAGGYTPAEGYPGGPGSGSGSGAGGGGGAGGAGGGYSGGTQGAGGSGQTWLNGTTYAGGGGGGGSNENPTGGAAGPGGGGAGHPYPTSSPGNAGTANRGGGGGGGNNGGNVGGINGGAGGSGIVIVRYYGTTQKGTGGTVTTSGGFTYHTFTTSGTYTA